MVLCLMMVLSLMNLKLSTLIFLSIPLNDLESYLTTSNLFNYINTESNSLCLSIGVPQGSILGPYLLSLYTNDLCPEIDIQMYAVHCIACA